MPVKAGQIVIDITAGTAKFVSDMDQARDPLRTSNDQLKLANDRLENDIRKLEGKPQNNLKTALDEARVAADTLADSLDKGLRSLNELMQKNSVSRWDTFKSAIAPWMHTAVATTPFSGWLGGATGSGGQTGEINTGLDDFTAKMRATNDPKEQEAIKAAARKWIAEKFAALDKAITDGVKGQFAGLTSNQMAAAASPGGADYRAIIESQVDSRRYLAEMARGAQEQFTASDLKVKKDDIGPGAEQRKSVAETLLRIERETAAVKLDQFHTLEAIDAEELNAVHNLAATHTQTQATLEANEKLYDAKRLAEYNRLAQETVNLHLDLASALKKVTTEEAAAAVYGPQFVGAVEEMEKRAKSAAEWAKEYNRITAETDSQSVRHRASMAGINGNPSDPLGTLATQQALERADIEDRYEEKLRIANTDLDRSIALREKELELQKLQDEMEERTAAARHKNLADFMREMQGQTKTAGDILYAAANSGLDSLSNNLAKLVTGQHKKTTFGKDMTSIGDTVVQSSMKAMLQKGLGAFGKKLGIKKQDGQSAPTAWYVQLANNTPVGPNPLASLPGVGQLPPALGKSGGSSGLGGILGGIGGFLGGLFGKGGGGGAATSVDSSITFMAGGGDADPGHVYGVAEAGEAELISPKNSSRITPLSKLGGGDVHNHYDIDARGADLGAENRVSRAIEAAHNSAVTNSQRAQAEHAKRTPQRR